MNLTDVANMIPAEYRDQILESNAIFKAIAVPADPHMQMLFVVWTTFVNSNSGMDMMCTKCLSEILANYKRLQAKMVDLRQADQFLEL